jgi:hypothetical protein
MSTLSTRYYKTTLAYLPSRFDRRVRDINRYFRIQISRRKIKQLLRVAMFDFNR